MRNFLGTTFDGQKENVFNHETILYFICQDMVRSFLSEILLLYQEKREEQPERGKLESAVGNFLLLQ